MRIATRRFHDLRHACASLLLAQGAHARTVMEVLGHSKISLTMNTYSHVMPELLRDAALVGTVTLESMGLVLNPFDRTLRPMRLMLALTEAADPESAV